MYKIVFTKKMRRDVKLAKKRGKDITKLAKVLDMIAQKVDLPIKYKDHQLNGELSDFRECHIEPDWLLVYQYLDDILVVVATATVTHADLFGM
ncbi:MAG: type II toxin-antitoxin system YafQ family toxin [Clostridiales bacterium]|nr:type II toxin-antitoxin system YafQ family toxin [Clostridiales bacterium]